MPVRCRSNCTTNKSIASCNSADKCSYTNGPKRKFCRLSSKYKMNKPDCNITRKFLKREKGPAAKIGKFLTRKYKSRKNTHALEIEDVLPTPPALSEPPNKEELKRITDKAHTRRIQRFMKAIDPHKRRSAYLNGVCSDSGVCIAFGTHTDTIKKHFNHFINFDYVKSLRKIGGVSANGFVKELEYENAGYKSHAILKSSSKETADNLYYEYLVGLFINEQIKYSPIFVETYGALTYAGNEDYNKMKSLIATKDALSGLTPLLPTDNIYTNKATLNESCRTSTRFAILIQHIKDAESLSKKCASSTFVKVDLAFVLFQIYHTLYLLNDTFTHNDLHTENVLIYEPVKDGYIQYHYHTKTGTTYAFKSAYIPKIIDYGRCFYNFNRPVNSNDIHNSSRTIYKEVCKLPGCKPGCGKDKGYQWMKPSKTGISAHDPNISMDLRLLRMVFQANVDFGGSTYTKMFENIMRHGGPLVYLLSKLNYKKVYFTPNNTVMGSALPTPRINNILDAHIMLTELIQRPDMIAQNENRYSSHKKIGDMHVYEDRPLEFISGGNVVPP